MITIVNKSIRRKYIETKREKVFKLDTWLKYIEFCKNFKDFENLLF